MGQVANLRAIANRAGRFNPRFAKRLRKPLQDGILPHSDPAFGIEHQIVTATTSHAFWWKRNWREWGRLQTCARLPIALDGLPNRRQAA